MNLDYLLPPSVEKREHVAKQEAAPSHAPFSKREKVCGTVPSAPGFLPITATLQATSHYVTFLLVFKTKIPARASLVSLRLTNVPLKQIKKRLQKLFPKLCNVDTNYLVILFLTRFLNNGSFTGPLFPIGIENLIYTWYDFFCYGSSNGY